MLDKPMMDMAVDAKRNKGDCTTELTKLAVSCPLGTDMFMQYCPFVVARHVNTFMRAEADKIAELDSMAVYVHEMVEWEKKSKVARSPSERTISISSSIRLCPFWNCISLEMSVNTPCVS